MLVFDEAQLGGTRTRSRPSTKAGKSEPEHFIEFAERIPGWCVVIGLIGTGQEIHEGEEGGLVQWRRAVERAESKGKWRVHGPPRALDAFSGTRE